MWATGFDLITDQKTLLGLGNTTGRLTNATQPVKVDGYIVGMHYDNAFDMDYFQFITVDESKHQAACSTY